MKSPILEDNVNVSSLEFWKVRLAIAISIFSLVFGIVLVAFDEMFLDTSLILQIIFFSLYTVVTFVGLDYAMKD